MPPTASTTPAPSALTRPADVTATPVDGACPAGARAQVMRFLGAATDGAVWSPMSGGRANRVWHVPLPSGDAIVKLYEARAASRLFPNTPRAEARVLTALAGSGLAPNPLRYVRTEDGPVLIYRAVPGRTLAEGAWPSWVEDLALCLARLHRLIPPRGHRRASVAPAALRWGISADLAGLPASEATRQVIRHTLRPVRVLPPAIPAPVLLHGDPVPGNVVRRICGGITLIDWQCPAIGDPVRDLALALSPGMRWLYGCEPITPDEQRRFWQAYFDPSARARYAALLPLLSARIAAHCLAQAARGRPGYAEAARAEIAALEQ